MGKPVKLTADGQQNLQSLARHGSFPLFAKTELEAEQKRERVECERRRRQREEVNAMELAADLAACWAHAQQQLTGRVPDIEDMPANYNWKSYVRDRLAYLDRPDATVAAAACIAYDCLDADGVEECLSNWEWNFICDLVRFKNPSERQEDCLKRSLRKLTAWANDLPPPKEKWPTDRNIDLDCSPATPGALRAEELRAKWGRGR